MLEKYGIEGVYVVHAKNGYEIHEKRIISEFSKRNISFQFITKGDPSEFNSIDLNTYFTFELQNRIKAGPLSCTLNHIFALEQVVLHKNKFAIIFENDPYFIGDFNKKMKAIALEAQTIEPGFIISLENTTQKYPTWWQAKSSQVLYKANGSRCAGAYMVDYEGAKAMLASLETEKCNNIIDWWQNRVIERNVVRMYWAHPIVIEQGSHNGLLCSSISTKEKSLKRRISWSLQKFYKYYFRRLFPQILVQ